MINDAIDHIVRALNAYINLRVQEDDWVVYDNLILHNGQENNDARDHIVLSLVNVEEDRIFRPTESFRLRPDGQHEKVKPEVRLNLYLLFAANLTQYDEALKALAFVVAFFQSKPAIEYREIAALAAEPGRLVFELQSLTFEQVNHLWGALGAKYRPSVVYRVRATPIRDDEVDYVVRPVEEIQVMEARP